MPVVLFLGRVAAKKRVETLVQALASDALRATGAHLVIAGPDSEGLVTGLRRRAAELGLAHRVHFPGMVSGNDKAAILSRATVWALPSIGENFGIAVVEALAAGTAVVVSPEVNLAAVIEQEGGGSSRARNR